MRFGLKSNEWKGENRVVRVIKQISAFLAKVIDYTYCEKISSYYTVNGKREALVDWIVL